MKKKHKLILLIIVLVVISASVIVNLADCSLPEGVFTANDLPPASLEPTNGFYIIWGLAQPEGVDVTSEEFVKPIRDAFTPDEGVTTAFRKFDTAAYRKHFSKYNDQFNWETFPAPFSDDLLKKVWANEDEIIRLQGELAVPLARFRQLVAAEEIVDFSIPHPETPLPNLLALMKFARLDIYGSMTGAAHGNWESAVDNILTNIAMLQRLLPNTRVSIINLTVKEMMMEHLYALNCLMNHPDCPPEVYPRIVAGLVPLTYEQYGARQMFICECLMHFATIDMLLRGDYDEDKQGNINSMPKVVSFLFLQPNRTKSLFYNHFATHIRYDVTPPYKWKDDPVKIIDEQIKNRHALWWVRNFLGRMIFDVIGPQLHAATFKSYRLKAFHDMTRIAAELHQHYSPGQNVPDVLKQLETYKALDPGTGKPYKWHEVKNLLYSIGTDGTDDDAVENRTKRTNTDWPVPVVLKKSHAAESITTAGKPNGNPK